ncbi:MAG: carbon-nitrogen hydrolase family protein [Prolixibacteraceae bacterium]|nr:carbon-nitrogen hydrolase family protein [Prolixibacteraceae bacterium]
MKISVLFIKYGKSGEFLFILFILLASIMFSARNIDDNTNCCAESHSVSKQNDKQQVKVAAAQILTGYDLEKNREKIINSILEADNLGCEIILFHEGCLTGYPGKDQLENTDFETVRKIEKEIRDLAGNLNIAVLLGSSGKEGDSYTNYVLVINEEGEVLGKYKKTWRAGEPYYEVGRGPVIFNLAGVECTVIICHDLRYPELVRLSVAAGAKVVFIANNESGITYENKLLGYRSMQISRATENMVYSVMCNSPANPEHINAANQSHGNSKIVDPLGNVMDEAMVFEERLVIATLDLNNASGSPVTRTTGENSGTEKTYGTPVEIPEYTKWVRDGLCLVKRLDGSEVEEYLKNK